MKLFKKILIANRGEIACRIIRAAHEMGIAVVAVYAENERQAPHVRMSDEAYSLGSGSLAETYLSMNRIIEVAQERGCDAIHPGYGFLSENPAFIAACNKAGITFIGPGAEAVRLMGNKVAARETVTSLGIPVLEGQTGQVDEILAKSNGLKYPLLVKAAAGGGGKGMRIVREAGKMKEALEAASREASSYFGDPTVYVERYLDAPRHIEVQVFGDHHGNVAHLFERECSIQRRYQKIIEEAPSPSLNLQARERITASAVRIAAAIGYSNAGTIEFLVDEELNYYFLEMNTRIQVEHPVTEEITGIDLVVEQIRVAAGYPLSFKQEDISIHGHAIECRIYAEDPGKQFMPSPGIMTYYQEPDEAIARVESGIGGAWMVLPDYDPMMAKIICWGHDRDMAIERMKRALEQMVIHGIASNVSFLCGLIGDEAYQENRVSTHFCDNALNRLLSGIEVDSSQMVSAYLAWWLFKQPDSTNIWDQIGYWRINQVIQLRVHDEEIRVEIQERTMDTMTLTINNTCGIRLKLLEYEKHWVRVSLDEQPFSAYVSEDQQGNAWVTMQGQGSVIHREDVLVKEDIYIYSGTGKGQDPGRITSPMPGKVVKVLVNMGDEVKQGDVLLIVEAMKMENSIMAPVDGKVAFLNVEAGDKVDTTSRLLGLEITRPDQ